MAKARLTMILDVPDEKDIEKLKKLEHHVDYILNLEEYPEITSVSEVSITKLEGDN